MNERAIGSYRDLRIWQEAMPLAESCYRLTSTFPREEMFGLTSQIRRSGASIPANIAEGHGRENTQSFIQFLRIAQGSLKESETHLLLAERVDLIGEGVVGPLMVSCETLGKRIRLLIRTLQRKVTKS